jgi:hypothetical protein
MAELHRPYIALRPDLPELRRPLAARSLVGRELHCLIQVEHPRVSREHALISWSGGAWTLRDLGSRNGTWVGQERVAPGQELTLRPGDPLTFGDPSAGTWLLEEPSAPGAVALRLSDGRAVAAVGDLLQLDDPDGHVHATLLRDATGDWVIEEEERCRVVREGELLEAGGPWRLMLPVDVGLTLGAESTLRLPALRLCFEVSRDQEHVRLELEQGGQRRDLGEKTHWFVLYVLARERLKDQHGAEHDQGWLDMDRLARLTCIDRRSLDTYLSRCRKELAEAGVEQGAAVVLARPGQRRLGVGPEQLLLR